MDGQSPTAVTFVAERRRRLGGSDGNEILTSATAVVLTVLLVAEGITILRIGDLRAEHMFIGMVLLGPVLLKLASTGYRFVRYYAGARAYREKGPPPLALRLLGPVLVAATLAVFASGVALLAIGHRSDAAMTVHKASFIVWGACFAVHFLAHLPRVARSVSTAWTRSGRRRVDGTPLRLMLLGASLGGGVAVALAVLPAITSWHGRSG